MRTYAPQTTINLFSDDQIDNLDFKNPFFSSHLITYIGNKRRLLPFLYKGFSKIRDKNIETKIPTPISKNIFIVLL